MLLFRTACLVDGRGAADETLENQVEIAQVVEPATEGNLDDGLLGMLLEFCGGFFDAAALDILDGGHLHGTLEEAAEIRFADAELIGQLLIGDGLVLVFVYIIKNIAHALLVALFPRGQLLGGDEIAAEQQGPG